MNVSYFQEKENLAGKKDIVLFIECKKCDLNEENNIQNKKCINCLLFNLFLHKYSNISFISNSKNDILIESHHIEIFLD